MLLGNSYKLRPNSHKLGLCRGNVWMYVCVCVYVCVCERVSLNDSESVWCMCVCVYVRSWCRLSDRVQ